MSYWPGLVRSSMAHLNCHCGHSIKIHNRKAGEGPVDYDKLLESLTDAVLGHKPWQPIRLAKECLHYDCTCDSFAAAPLPVGEYIRRDDELDISGYEVVAYRSSDTLARRCWECRYTLAAEQPRYIVRFFSSAGSEELEYLENYTVLDEPPTFANTVMCVDCVHLDVADLVFSS